MTCQSLSHTFIGVNKLRGNLISSTMYNNNIEIEYSVIPAIFEFSTKATIEK